MNLQKIEHQLEMRWRPPIVVERLAQGRVVNLLIISLIDYLPPELWGGGGGAGSAPREGARTPH